MDLDSPFPWSHTNSNDTKSVAASGIDTVNTIDKELNNQLCEQCDTGGNLDYCNVCDAIFCDKCWDVQLSHKKQRLAPGSIPHERTIFDTAQKIKSILELRTNAEQQNVLHQDDEDTTCFGIVRENAELPVFQDYGRYARIMADTQGVLSGQHLNTHDQRYPSLVSFVGQTGA